MRGSPAIVWHLAGALFLLLATTPLYAAEDADGLYAKGRYKEAAQAYQRLDMDRPADLRYRYDRGCAAFMAGDLDQAKAAFASVLRRGTDEDMRFRALYNLGNTYYKLNDFAAARDSYREALKVRPGDADARHNLELSLKALKEQQEGRDRKKQDSSKDQEKGQQGQDRGGQGTDQKGQDRQGEGKDQGGQKAGQQDSAKDKGQQGPSREQGKGQDTRDTRGEGRQDLKGELKSRDMQAGKEREGRAGEAESAAAMERNKAEALLDNMGERRSGMRDYQGSGKAVVGSGKEW